MAFLNRFRDIFTRRRRRREEQRGGRQGQIGPQQQEQPQDFRSVMLKSVSNQASLSLLNQIERQDEEAEKNKPLIAPLTQAGEQKVQQVAEEEEAGKSDFIRGIEEQNRRFLDEDDTSVPDLAAAVLRAFPRAIGAIELEGENRLRKMFGAERNEADFSGTKLGRFVFGEEPIRDFKGEGQNLRSALFGKEVKERGFADFLIGGTLVGLDAAFPGLEGAARETAEKAFRNVSTSKNIDEIFGFIKESGFLKKGTTTDDQLREIAETLVDIDSPELVEQTLRRGVIKNSMIDDLVEAKGIDFEDARVIADDMIGEIDDFVRGTSLKGDELKQEVRSRLVSRLDEVVGEVVERPEFAQSIAKGGAEDVARQVEDIPSVEDTFEASREASRTSDFDNAGDTTRRDIDIDDPEVRPRVDDLPDTTPRQNLSEVPANQAREADSLVKVRSGSTIDESFDAIEYADEMAAKQKAALNAEKKGPVLRAKNFFDKLKKSFVDGTSPIQDPVIRAQKAMKISSIEDFDIRDAIDEVNRHSDLAYGFMEREGLNDIVQSFADQRDFERFEQFLIARQAVDVSEAGIETGRSLAKDQALASDPRASERYLENAKKVYQYTHRLLDQSVVMGLIDERLAKTLKELYPNYVPIERILDPEDPRWASIVSRGGGVGSISKQGIVRRLSGSELEIRSPMESLVNKTTDLFKQGTRNKVATIVASTEKIPGNPLAIKRLRNAENVERRIQIYTNLKVLRKELNKKVSELTGTKKDIGKRSKQLVESELNKRIKTLRSESKNVSETERKLISKEIKSLEKDLKDAKKQKQKVERGLATKELKKRERDLKSEEKNVSKLESKMAQMEEELAKLDDVVKTEFNNFMDEGMERQIKTSGGFRVRTIPVRLQKFETTARKAKTFEEFSQNPDVMRADLDGFIQRGGFPDLKKFYDTAKNPVNTSDAATRTTRVKANMDKLLKSQAASEELVENLEIVRDLDLLSGREATGVARGLVDVAKKIRKAIIKKVAPSDELLEGVGIQRDIDLTTAQDVESFAKGLVDTATELRKAVSKGKAPKASLLKKLGILDDVGLTSAKDAEKLAKRLVESAKNARKGIVGKKAAGTSRIDSEAFLKEIGITEDVGLASLRDAEKYVGKLVDDIVDTRKALMAEAKSIQDLSSKGKSTISLLKKGVKEVYEVPSEIADAAKNMGAEQINSIVKAIGIATRLVKLGATGLNIPFIASNFVRDQHFGFIMSEAGLKELYHPVTLMKALFETVGHGKIYKEMVAKGAIGTSFDISREQVPATLKKIRAQKNLPSKIKYTLTNPKEWLRMVEDFVGRSEEFTRIQQYVAVERLMKARGVDSTTAKILAVRAARENTVNFMRSGDVGKVLNMAVPYFNASVQGTRRTLRGISDPKTRKKTLLRIFTTIMAPQAAVTAWNISSPERRAAYEDFREYEKENNLIILPEFPEKDAQGRWNAGKIPITPGIANFGSFARRAVESGYGDKPVELAAFLHDVVGIVSPIGTTTREVVSATTPTLIKSGIEPLVNKNLFTLMDIVPPQRVGASPEFQVRDPITQGGKPTSGTIRKVAKAAGALPGIEKGGVSPAKLENFVGTVFPGVSAHLLNRSDRILASAGLIPETQIGGESFKQNIIRRFSKVKGGESLSQAFEALETSKRKGADEKVILDQQALILDRELSKMPSADANQIVAQIKSENEKLFNRIKKIRERRQNEFTALEGSLQGMGVNSGVRAEAILDVLDTMGSKEEKNAFMARLGEQKLLGKDFVVRDQIARMLFERGDDEAIQRR